MSDQGYLENLFSLKGKTVLFTGAGGGIGSEVATGLALAGAHVALCDIDIDSLLAIKKNIVMQGGRASCFELDITDMENISQCVKEVAEINGNIDILVNCAGINRREGLADVSEGTYDHIMDINLKGVFFVSKAVAPYMKKQNGGSIINIGSHNTGWLLGGCSVYGATKSAVWSLTKSMSVEWAKYNIRANCVSPGHIKTALTTATWEHPERSKYLLDRIALNRPGYPDDIVGVCILLAADCSAYITGCEYRVDGGCMSGGQPWPYDTEF
jgi:Dehydrogenases with different specificities (related to short-chain alcohol dehydrogenases)